MRGDDSDQIARIGMVETNRPISRRFTPAPPPLERSGRAFRIDWLRSGLAQRGRDAEEGKTAAKSAATLHKAGLIDHPGLSDDHRKRLAKLNPAEVKALVAAKKKLGFSGKLGGAGADFF